MSYEMQRVCIINSHSDIFVTTCMYQQKTQMWPNDDWD